MAETRGHRRTSRFDRSMSIRDLDAYRDLLGPRFGQALEKLKRSRKKHLDVLDVGAGYGLALGEIKRALLKFKRTVDIDAVSLAIPDAYAELRQAAIQQRGLIATPNRYLEMPAELFKPDKKYDLIVSVFGAVSYSKHPLAIVKGMFKALKPGGEAHLFETLPEGTVEKVRRLAKRQGLQLKLEGLPGRVWRVHVRKKSR